MQPEIEVYGETSAATHFPSSSREKVGVNSRNVSHPQRV